MLKWRPMAAYPHDLLPRNQYFYPSVAPEILEPVGNRSGANSVYRGSCAEYGNAVASAYRLLGSAVRSRNHAEGRRAVGARSGQRSLALLLLQNASRQLGGLLSQADKEPSTAGVGEH